jgi:Domain of unknown function (DUF5122) beta-propeller
MHLSFTVRVAVAGSALVLVPAAAEAAAPQARVTAQNAVAYTPQLVSTGTERVRVDALTVAGTRTYAGGRFSTVTQGGKTYRGLGNIMAFNTNTGAVDAGFDAQFDAPVTALEAAPGGGVFAGGAFTRVNGVARPGLVKLRANGTVDTSFKPYFTSGTVNDLELATVRGQRRLIVAGAMPGKLAAVNLDTGANTGALDAVFSDPIPGARGAGTSVFNLAVSPNGTRLIATGNFRTVSVRGTSRARRAFVMLDMPSSTRPTVIDPWYYPGFGKSCSATPAGDARRIANLQGVDWSPDGSHFDVTATGKVSLPGDVWHAWDTDAHNAGSSVCDGVGRFSLRNDNQAEWINYSGGDSIWTVQDTGSAVYVQGHMRWMDNPDGFASKGIGDRTTGAPAALRRGVAAINPSTGKAIASWAPPAPAQAGGKALVATRSGIWWGSDSLTWNGKARHGLAFTPSS